MQKRAGECRQALLPGLKSMNSSIEIKKRLLLIKNTNTKV